MLEKMWSNGNTHPLLVAMQTYATTLEISVAVSQNIESQPTSGSSNTTLENISKRCSILIQRNLFKCVHSSIFVKARTWKQPRCPSKEEWIKIVWHIYTLEYYSMVKNNDILNSAYNWMELENTILSEITHSQKYKFDTSSIISGYYP